MRNDKLLFLIVCVRAISVCLAHQSISAPVPISTDQACRIGGGASCPGPCPRKGIRKDQNPYNPAVTVRRSGWLTARTLKNSHVGGFSRWSIVNVRDIYRKDIHRANAFLYTCADLSPTKCQKRNQRRDCKFDRYNEFYLHRIQIPAIYRDGVYLLGWVWYGGAEATGWGGSFGDYYDCIYIRIKGGPTAYSYTPQFKPGPSKMGRGGSCRATVNRVGVCWREPCPGGKRKTQFLKPAEFVGRIPPVIRRARFLFPFQPRKRAAYSPYVRSLTIRSSDYPPRIITSSQRGRNLNVLLTRRMRPTVTCEISGRARYVQFFVNGQPARRDPSPPYSITADYYPVMFGKRRLRYYPWHFDVTKRYMTLSCVAYGLDGTQHWRTVEVNTLF